MDNTLKKTLWQDNAITIAHYDITALEKNIIYMVMAQISKQDGYGKVYLVSEGVISKMTNRQIDNKLFREAAKRLLGRTISFYDNNGNFIQTNLIASAVHLKNKGIIEITISEPMLRFYINLKEKFTTFQLDTAISLSGKYAKRFYELCSMYKKMQNKTFVIPVIELKKMMGVIDDKGKDSYVSFTYFKDSVITPSQKELEEKADVAFDFEPIEGKKEGKGRKPIESIKFTISLKNQSDLEAISELSERHQVIIERLIDRLKLRKDQALAILEKYTIEEINKMVYEMSLSKDKIKNVGAYAAKLFGV